MIMNKSADYRLLCLKTTNKCVVSVDLGESIMNSILLASALLWRKGLFGKLARAFISPRNLPVHIISAIVAATRAHHRHTLTLPHQSYHRGHECSFYLVLCSKIYWFWFRNVMHSGSRSKWYCCSLDLTSLKGSDRCITSSCQFLTSVPNIRSEGSDEEFQSHWKYLTRFQFCNQAINQCPLEQI